MLCNAHNRATLRWRSTSCIKQEMKRTASTAAYLGLVGGSAPT